jgi:hypothetical protein
MTNREAAMISKRFDIASDAFRRDFIGKSRAEIDAVLGEGRPTRRGALAGEEGVSYVSVNARAAFRDGYAVEVGFAPPAPIFFKRQSLFDHPALWREIAAMDIDTRENLGFLIMPNLGLTLTGFYDNDRSQLAVTVFEAGRCDDLSA